MAALIEEDPYFMASNYIQRIHQNIEESIEENSSTHCNGHESLLELMAALDEADNLVDGLDKYVASVKMDSNRVDLPSYEVHRRKENVELLRQKTRIFKQKIQEEMDKRTSGYASESTQSTTPNFIPSNRGKDKYKMEREKLIANQDEQLDELAKSAERLHQTATHINMEISDHQRLLMELDSDVDREAARMNRIMAHISRLLRNSSRRVIITVLVLLILIIIALLILTLL